MSISSPNHLSGAIGTLSGVPCTKARFDVIEDILRERIAQETEHGDQSHLPDGTGPDAWLSLDDYYLRRHGIRRGDLADWAKARTDRAAQQGGDGSVSFEHILTEEWAEAMAEDDPVRLREELIQVAAVAVQWIEAIDARGDLS